MEPVVIIKSPTTSDHELLDNRGTTSQAPAAEQFQTRSATTSGHPSNGQVLTRPHVSPNLRTKNRHSVQGYTAVSTTTQEQETEFAKCVVVQKPPQPKHGAAGHFRQRPLHSKFSTSQPQLNTEERLRRQRYSQSNFRNNRPGGHAAFSRKQNRFSFAGVGTQHQKRSNGIEHYFPSSYNVSLTKLSLEDLRPQPVPVPVPSVPNATRYRYSSYTVDDTDDDDDIDMTVSQALCQSEESIEEYLYKGSEIKPVDVTIPRVPLNTTHKAMAGIQVKDESTLVNYFGNESTQSGLKPVYNGKQYIPNNVLQRDPTLTKAHSNGIQPMYHRNQLNNSQVPQHVYVHQSSSNGLQNEHSIALPNEAKNQVAHGLNPSHTQPTPTQSVDVPYTLGYPQTNKNTTIPLGNGLQHTVNQQWQNGTQNIYTTRNSNKVDVIDGTSISGTAEAFESSVTPTDPRVLSYSWPNSPSDLYQASYQFQQLQSLTSSTSQVNPATEYHTGSHNQYPSYSSSVKLSNSQIKQSFVSQDSAQGMSFGDLTGNFNTALSIPESNRTSPTCNSPVSSCSTCQVPGCTADYTNSSQSIDSPISGSISISPFSPATAVTHGPLFRGTQSEGTLLAFQHKQQHTMSQPMTTGSLQFCAVPLEHKRETDKYVYSVDTVTHDIQSSAVGSERNNEHYIVHQKSSTLPASYRKSPKHDRSNANPVRRSTSLLDILEVDETDHDVSRAEMKLRDYADLNANRLPQKVKICKGFCSQSSEVTLSRGEVFNFHFAKHTTVLTVCDSQGVHYSIPLNSLVKLAIVYNPFNVKTVGAAHTQGFQFKSTQEMMSLKYLPNVLSVTRGYYDPQSPENSLNEGELLVVNGVKKTHNENVLKVVSSNDSKTKFLKEDCEAHFTTSTLTTQMTVEDMFRLSVALPQKAILFVPEENVNDFPSHLLNTAVTLKHFNVVKSIIATPAVLYNTAKPPQAIEIMVDLDTDIQEVVDISESKHTDLLSVTQAVYNTFDQSKVLLYKDTPNGQAYDVQTTLWTKLDPKRKTHGVYLNVSQFFHNSSVVRTGTHVPSNATPSTPKALLPQTQTDGHLSTAQAIRHSEEFESESNPSLPSSKFELEIRLKAVELRSVRVDEEVVKLSRDLSNVSREITQIKLLLQGNATQTKGSAVPRVCDSTSTIPYTQGKQEMPTDSQQQQQHDKRSIAQRQQHKHQATNTGRKKESQQSFPVHQSRPIVQDQSVPHYQLHSSPMTVGLGNQMTPESDIVDGPSNAHAHAHAHVAKEISSLAQQDDVLKQVYSYSTPHSATSDFVKGVRGIDVGTQAQNVTRKVKSHKMEEHNIMPCQSPTSFTPHNTGKQLPTPKHEKRSSVKPPVPPKPQRRRGSAHKEQAITSPVSSPLRVVTDSVKHNIRFNEKQTPRNEQPTQGNEYLPSQYPDQIDGSKQAVNGYDTHVPHPLSFPSQPDKRQVQRQQIVGNGIELTPTRQYPPQVAYHTQSTNHTQNEQLQEVKYVPTPISGFQTKPETAPQPLTVYQEPTKQPIQGQQKMPPRLYTPEYEIQMTKKSMNGLNTPTTHGSLNVSPPKHDKVPQLAFPNNGEAQVPHGVDLNIPCDNESTYSDVETAENEIDAIVNDLTLFCSEIEDELSKYSSSTDMLDEGPTLV